MKTHHRVRLLLLLAATLSLAACGRRAASQAAGDASAEPDKVLYAKGVDNFQHGRYEVGRLTMQTLMNSYPESEYLAKAKLAIADSYYKEGSAAGLLQAAAEYEDFITFFPFLDEAAYAAMQVGMSHYRRMEKPDRDRTETLAAESAFQAFLQRYPDSELAGQAQQHLREVQEVLAEGDFAVANFYVIRKADRAAAARLEELTKRYPLYSQADRANWTLATIYERHEAAGADIAAPYYARIVRDYPLSPLAAGAKARLEKLGVPVPEPDPVALARMRQEQQTPRPRGNMLARSAGLLKSGPDVSMAARSGMPTLTPEEEDDSTDTLAPGGALTLGRAAGSTGGAPAQSGAYVEQVTPAPSSAAAPAPATSPAPTASQPAAGDPSTPASTASTDSSSSTPSASQKTGDPQNESSSDKKKKGLRKLIPF